MKTQVFWPGIIAASLCAACNSSTTDSSTIDSANISDTAQVTSADKIEQEQAKDMNITPLDNKSAEFLTAAAGGGMMEVSLGKIAGENGANQRVKDFGAMMATDHAAANNEIMALASSRGLTISAAMPEKHQKHIDGLSKKKGKDFDKAYMKMMVDDHEKDIKEFEKVAKDTGNADVRSFASKTLPTLRKHLDSAKAINKSL